MQDYEQDGDEEALFKEVALGYLFLGIGKAVEKGFRMWKASRAADEMVEVLEEGARAGDEVIEGTDEVAEIVTRQQGVIDDVENGRQALSSNKRKGNYREMKMDRHLESLTEINGNPASLTRISDGAVESLDQTIVRGIDGVYENATPPPRFIIAEAKYNTSRLGNTLDGPQMSDDWILGSERLERILPPDIADDIRFALEQGTGDAQRVLTHIDTSGNVVTSSIDATGAIVGAWP